METRYNEARSSLHYVCNAIDSGAITTSATPKSITPTSTPRVGNDAPHSPGRGRAVIVMEVDAEEEEVPEPSKCQPVSPSLTRPGHGGARFLDRSSSPIGAATASSLTRASSSYGANPGRSLSAATASSLTTRASSGCGATPGRSLSAAGASAEALLQDMRALRKRKGAGVVEAKHSNHGRRQQRAVSAESCRRNHQLQFQEQLQLQHRRYQQQQQQLQLQPPSPAHSSSQLQWPLPSPPCGPPLSIVRAAAAVEEKAVADLMSLNPDPAPVQCRGHCATPGRRLPAADGVPLSARWR